jgi:putative nucleotidyltransferase with HDIG domain
MRRRRGPPFAAYPTSDRLSLVLLNVAGKVPLPDSPEQLVSSAPELEALPVVAQRALAILRDERTSVDMISNLLGTDQALASAVLRYANSARAMPNRRIANLREAVARIGQRALSEVLVRACAGPMLDRGLPPYALPRSIAWRHAATVSTASRALADLLKTGSEEAGVAGLLHDVGKMVLTSVVPEAAAEAVSIARSRRMPVWQAEQEVLGFHHGAVGAALLRSWGLPDSVVYAVAFHHQPEAADSALATIVSLADAAAFSVGAVGGGGACPQPAWDPAPAYAMGATPEQIQDFLDNLKCVEDGAL